MGLGLPQNLRATSAFTARHMHVEQHDVRLGVRNHLDGARHIRRLPDDREVRLQRGYHAGAEHLMIIHHRYANALSFLLAHQHPPFFSCAFIFL